MTRDAAPLRVVVVDDEALARERVLTELDGAPDVQVVAECADGEAAVRAVAEHAPDVLFLDVQMPGMTGFDVLRALPPEVPAPVVVFVTAYDRFALQAFEARAIDYLVKPFTRERLLRALERARTQVRGRDADGLDPRVRALLDALRPAARHQERFMVRRGKNLVLVRADDIHWVEAADNYVELHTAGGSHLLRGSITGMQERLDPSRFLRIHRRIIVNVDRIVSMQPWGQGEYVVRLSDGTEVNSSRSYRDQLMALGEQRPDGE